MSQTLKIRGSAKVGYHHIERVVKNIADNVLLKYVP